ncbi:Hypothetical protein POVR2_LOCUS284 [uncultured virus]|nr:Hypothetical protein POVR2_LOCUS284 [uncultured virus]
MEELEPLEVLRLAIKNSTAAEVRNVIEKYDIDPAYLDDEVPLAAVNNKLEVMELLLDYTGYGSDIDLLGRAWQDIVDNQAVDIIRYMTTVDIIPVTMDDLFQEAMERHLDKVALLALEYMDEDGSYFETLSYLVSEHATALQLLDWMICLRESSFQLAAAAALEDRLQGLDPDIVPIAALMLLILHPSMSKEELLTRMKNEGWNDGIWRRCELLLLVMDH